MIKATIKGWGAANCLQILCCRRWQGGDWENRWGIFVLKHNRIDIQLQLQVWILIGSFWPDIWDIAGKPKRIYQQQQRETTMDGRNCHSVVKKIYLCFKTKTHYVPHNLEIYLVPFFTGQNWIAWSKMIRNFWQDWRSSSFNHPPMR